MSQQSFGARLFIQLLKKSRFGSVLITFPDGRSESYGNGAQVAKVKLNNWEILDVMINKGDVGLAEGIMNEDLEVDNSAALIQWACQNDQALDRAIHGTWLGTLFYYIKNTLKRNSKAGAKKNIQAHYDLGNDFYKLWLDETMSYSSGIFKKETDTLKQAQLNKYDRMIDVLDLKSSDHILEIGCGWGGFFSRAVERTGCKVTAVMNSPSQAAHNRQLIQKNGMVKHIELQEIDYRDIRGKFDKVVSIEMIEAVGEAYWDNYFQKVAASVKSKGKAVIQGITIKDSLFATYRQKPDFIQSYIFPGGMLLANSIFDRKSRENGMYLSEQFEFGESYANTLNIWNSKFLAAKNEVKRLGFDDKFIRMWSLYLAYCEGAFRAGRINVGQYLLEST